MCPGYAEAPMGVLGLGHPNNFGKLLCGCGENYGGPQCDIGCPPLNYAVEGGGVIDVTIGSRTYCVKVEDERTHEAMRLTGKGAAASGPTRVTAVMPGIVREVRVAPGDEVEAGTPLMILEAMKMQNPLCAEAPGKVARVLCKEGEAVAAGALLVQEAGGLVSDFKGGNDYLNSGNIVAGNPKCFKALLQTVNRHLSEN